MRNISILLSLLFVLSTCKKDEDNTVLVNATVANSSEGTVDFKSGDYAIGSSVTFTATPKTGYVFSSWTNTSTNQTYTTNPLSITVNENTNLVANFEKAAYNIMFTISGQGSVQKEVVGGGGFTHGSQVKLTATPSDNYSFFYWNNDPGDTENPKTITLEGDQNIPTKFDYQVARDLVGNWEFVISDPASKNVTTIKMSIDIFLNVLMTTVVNGEVISQIFTQMVAISTSAIVIGNFAVITDVVVASATSLSMNMISIPEDTAPPTNESEIPDTGTELNLSGNKSDEEPETDEDGIIIPPTDATTSSSTTEDIGDVFDESFNQLAEAQSSTVASNTSNTGTTTSTESSDFFTNHAGKIWIWDNSQEGEIDYHTFVDNGGRSGEPFIINYLTTSNYPDYCGLLIIGKNYFDDSDNGCDYELIELIENRSNYLRLKYTEIYFDSNCNPTIRDSAFEYINYEVKDNILTETQEEYGDKFTYYLFTGTGIFSDCFDSPYGETDSTTGTTTSTTGTTTPTTGTTTSTSTTGTSTPTGGGNNTGTTTSTGGVNPGSPPTSTISSPCTISIKPYTLSDFSNTISMTAGVAFNPSCGSNNGRISFFGDQYCQRNDLVTKYEASGLPPGINLSMLVPGEMVLCGTPTNQASGTYNFSVTGYFGDSLSSASASLTMTRTIYVINNSGSNSSTDCNVSENMPPPLQLAGGTTANVVTETGEYFEIRYENGKEHTGGGFNLTWDNEPDNVVAEGYVVGIIIKGSPTTVGTYNYTLTSNAQYNCSTAPVTGTLVVQASTSSNTTNELVLSSDVNTLNQSVCVGSNITPIVFQFSGDANAANINGLPPGLNSNINVSSNGTRSLEIMGAPTNSVTASTVYNYTVTSDGSQSMTISGSITINPDSNIVLVYGQPNTVVNSRSVGSESQITNTSFEITFSIQNASGYTLVWDDDSIAPSITTIFNPENGGLNISGNPGPVSTSTINTPHPSFKTYIYTITTTGNNNGCEEVSFNGSVEVVDVNAKTYTISVTASSASDYTLSGSDRNGNVTGNDPSITINVDDTIDFVVDASGHPFYLKTVQGTGTSDLVSGVTNNGATNATVTWTPTTAGTYYYQCSLHNGMYGTITVN